MKSHTPPRGFKEFLTDYQEKKGIFAKTNMKENKDNVIESMNDEDLNLLFARVSEEVDRRQDEKGLNFIKNLSIKGFSSKDIAVKVERGEYSFYLRVDNELKDIYYGQELLEFDEWTEFIPDFMNESYENCYYSDHNVVTTIKKLQELGFEIYE